MLSLYPVGMVMTREEPRYRIFTSVNRCELCEYCANLCEYFVHSRVNICEQCANMCEYVRIGVNTCVNSVRIPREHVRIPCEYVRIRAKRCERVCEYCANIVRICGNRVNTV